MRVQTEKWRMFIPGVRMYKGKKTIFYNGERLWEGDSWDGRPLIYNWQERRSWEVIIILPGVEVITESTFRDCWNVEQVIMADSVKRIEMEAFEDCNFLQFVKLSTSLEYIEKGAFWRCESLTSIFVPPSCSCRQIGHSAFAYCTQLIMLGMPQHVQLSGDVFKGTALMIKSPRIETVEGGDYASDDEEEVVQWVKSINDEEAYALHRACASCNPVPEIIHDLVKRNGIKAMKMKNAIGVTPSQYLEANTFAEISEKDIINRYILDTMGEVI